MNIAEQSMPIPDHITVPSDLSMLDEWDSAAVAGIIRAKSANGETPAFLFLGRKEALFLKNHLASSFGDDAVTNVNGTYYMGLRVVTIDCGTFLTTGGRKTIRTLQDPIARRPAWRDSETKDLWRFRL
ncbi:MAG: hypothetical protein ACQCXQ_16110 [Verrucomicrobiales bacterium]|nr:hypothetical protein [Verrucomicrobiota bacterium JB025]